MTIAFRIADVRHPVMDGMGASLQGGRWNSTGHRMVYAAQTYAGAVLEVLVHMSGARIPQTQKVTRIIIDDGISVETLEAERLIGWDAPGKTMSREFGDRWLEEERSVVLRFPVLCFRGASSTSS